MRTWILGSIFLLACSGGADVADAGPDAAVEAGPSVDAPVIPDKYAAFAQSFDAERQKLGAPGASVAIYEHGVLTFAHGFGTKGPNSTDPVLATTLFRMGSMTKALTATALLHENVDLGAHAKDLFPALDVQDPELASLTVAQLLTHQSGLYDYLAISGSTSDSALQSYLGSATFASNEYFMDPPGSMWNYSNPNYYIAGAIAERASGGTYRDLVTSAVLSPLGMTRTFFLPSDVVADGDFSNGKSVDQNGKPWDVSPTSYDNAWGRPAGYAFSSALDYGKFVSFLMHGDAAVLSADALAAMESPHVSTRELGDVESYGYGLFVDQGIFLSSNDYRSVEIVTHGGAVPGFATEFWMVPSTGFAIVTCANTDGAYFRTALANALASFGDLPAPSTPPDLSVPASSLDSMVGDYSDPHDVGTIHVTNDGGKLTVSMPLLDQHAVPYTPALVPYAPDSFYLTVQGQQLPVTFIRDTSGAVTFFRTRLFVGARVAQDVVHPMPSHPISAAALRAKLRVIGPLPPGH